MPPSSFLITAIAIGSAAAGLWLGSNKALSRKLVPFGGGALIGVALVWVLPELAAFFRWPVAVAWLAGGVAMLALIDRFVYPVCPACAPSHDHDHCSTRLHGFAMPLLAASALHAALDGWGAAAGEEARLSAGVVGGILAHKVPEGLALGVIARAALRSKTQAFLWCVIAQMATLMGAGLESMLAPQLSTYGLHVLVAIAGGSFLYLGGHAVHGEIRRSGGHPAVWPALTGMAGSGVLRLFMR